LYTHLFVAELKLNHITASVITPQRLQNFNSPDFHH